MFFKLKKIISVAYGTMMGNLVFVFSGCHVSGIVRCFGVPHIERRGGRMSLGRGAILKSSQVSSFMGLNGPCKFSTLSSDSEIVIGDGFQASACVLAARKSIRIGSRVMLGANVTILDNDCHSTDAINRQKKECDISAKSVVIEDDVFIGMNSIILKGVTIGARSIIAAGSVVTKSISADTIYGGNPAEKIGG